MAQTKQGRRAARGTGGATRRAGRRTAPSHRAFGDLQATVADARTAQARTAHVEQRRWFRWAARSGLAARGVIYGVMSVVAVDVAVHGRASAPASGEGAIEEVARQPVGPVLVAVLAVGLACYALWRLVEALSGCEKPGEHRNTWVRIGWLVIAGVYSAFCARAVLLLATGDQPASQGATKARAWASVVMGLPAGRQLLGAAGVGVMAGGAALAIWGITHDYDELRLDLLPRRLRLMPKVLGAAGDVARGAVVALVGLYMLDGALDGSATHVKTTDQALRALAHQHYGTVLIALVAAGLSCFATYSFVEAWLRDL